MQVTHFYKNLSLTISCISASFSIVHFLCVGELQLWHWILLSILLFSLWQTLQMLLHLLTIVTIFFLPILCFLCPLSMVFTCWLFNEKNGKIIIPTIPRFRTLMCYLIIFFFTKSSTFPRNSKITMVALNSILSIINMLITSQAWIICTILTY